MTESGRSLNEAAETVLQATASDATGQLRLWPIGAACSRPVYKRMTAVSLHHTVFDVQVVKWHVLNIPNERDRYTALRI